MVHLTNYSLSKFSAKFDHGGGEAGDTNSGCKRTLAVVLQGLEEVAPGFSASAAWEALAVLSRITVDAIAERSLGFSGSADPSLARCFHLLGLDVLFDAEGKPWLLEANHKPSLLIDEVHPLPGKMSSAEVNKLFAGQKRGGSKWGRPCRCALHPSVHEHQLCAADVACKLPAVQGALQIVQKARAGVGIEQWTEGTHYLHV